MGRDILYFIAYSNGHILNFHYVIKITIWGIHLPVHWWQVPNAADDGPAAHHPQKVSHQTKFTAVPKSISKARIILKKMFSLSDCYEQHERSRERYLNGSRIDGAADFEAPLLKHHHRCVVDTRTCKWNNVRILKQMFANVAKYIFFVCLSLKHFLQLDWSIF